MLYHKLHWGAQWGARIFTGGRPPGPSFEPPLVTANMLLI